MTSIEFNTLVYKASKSLQSPSEKISENRSREINDLIQSGLMNSMKYESQFKGAIRIKEWFGVVAEKTFLKKFMMAAAENTNAQVAVAECNESISSKLGKLDKVYQDSFVLHFSGFSNEEIAAKLNISVETVTLRINEARAILMSNM